MLEKLSKQTDRNHQWLGIVLNDFPEFLKDHAECERRSSNMALSIVAKHPDKEAITDLLIDAGIGKLQRFQQVYRFMKERQVVLPPENAHDLYVKQLQWLIRSGKEERFLDKLLVNAIIESREQERLLLLRDNMEDASSKTFYSGMLSPKNVYKEIVYGHFPHKVVDDRAKELAQEEEDIFSSLDLRPALH